MQNVHLARFLRQLAPLLPLLVVLTACAPTVGIFASGNWQVGTLPHEHIRSLAVDPNNPQNLYAGDAQDGVFTSTDGGLTWKQQTRGLTPNIAINALAFDDPGKKLYAATDAGLYVSANAAQSWSIVNGLPTGRYTTIAFDLKAAQTIYVGSAQHGIYVSLNSGTSWTAANSGLPAGVTINGLTFDSDAHQLWAATSTGVYRSPNGGISWEALNSGLPADSNVFTVLPASIAGGAPGLVYAGTDKGFYLSQDAAAHWQTSQALLSHISITAVLIDYHTVTTVYIATKTVGILRSTDSGETWSGVAPGLPTGQTVYALAQATTGYDQTFVAINNIYLYPGTGSIFDPVRLLPYVVVIAFFYLLIRLSMRGRRKSKKTPVPERSVEEENQREERPPLSEEDKQTHTANGEDESDSSDSTRH